MPRARCPPIFLLTHGLLHHYASRPLQEKHLRQQIEQLERLQGELQAQHAAYLREVGSLRACLRSATAPVL